MLDLAPEPTNQNCFISLCRWYAILLLDSSSYLNIIVSEIILVVQQQFGQ